MSLPEVSVIVRCFREKKEIFSRSIESVISQTKKDLEIIIILDAPDNTELKELILDYAQRCSSIIPIFNEVNIGRGQSANKALSIARGKYIAIHDADDIDREDRLMLQSDFLNQNPHVDIVFSNYVTVSPEREIISPRVENPDIENPSFFKRHLHNPTMMVKSETFRKYGFSGRNSCEDQTLWMNIFGERKNNFGFIDENLVEYLSLQNDRTAQTKKVYERSLNHIINLILFFPVHYSDKHYYRVLVSCIMDRFFGIFGEKGIVFSLNFRQNVKKGLLKLSSVFKEG